MGEWDGVTVAREGCQQKEVAVEYRGNTVRTARLWVPAR